MKRKKLTRDSDIYQSLIKDKVLKNARNATKLCSITDIGVNFNINWISEWSNLDKRGTEENVSEKRLRRLKSMSPSELSVELCGKGGPGFHNWTAQMEIIPKVHISFKVELPDGSTKTLSYENTITDSKDLTYFNELVSSINSESMVTFSNEGDKTIQTNYDTYNVSQGSDYHRRQYFSDEIEYFLTQDNSWVKCELCQPEYVGEDVLYPVKLGSSTDITIQFNISGKSQQFWDFTEKFGNGDPIQVGGERAYISLETLTRSQGFKDGTVWIVRKEKPSMKSFIKAIIG